MSGSDSRKHYALPDPYPEPRVLHPNEYYALLLLEDYAGETSELTAIHQFIYHHLALEEEYREVADMQKHIAITEMHHLNLLGETIRLLGIAPKMRTFTNNTPTYWRSSFVYYGTDVCDRLAADMAAEKSSILQYRNHLKLIEDPHIKKLLERIIADEELHLQMYRNAAMKFCPGLIKPRNNEE